MNPQVMCPSTQRLPGAGQATVDARSGARRGYLGRRLPGTAPASSSTGPNGFGGPSLSSLPSYQSSNSRSAASACLRSVSAAAVMAAGRFLPRGLPPLDPDHYILWLRICPASHLDLKIGAHHVDRCLGDGIGTTQDSEVGYLCATEPGSPRCVQEVCQ